MAARPKSTAIIKTPKEEAAIFYTVRHFPELQRSLAHSASLEAAHVKLQRKAHHDNAKALSGSWRKLDDADGTNPIVSRIKIGTSKTVNDVHNLHKQMRRLCQSSLHEVQDPYQDIRDRMVQDRIMFRRQDNEQFVQTAPQSPTPLSLSSRRENTQRGKELQVTEAKSGRLTSSNTSVNSITGNSDHQHVLNNNNNNNNKSRGIKNYDHSKDPHYSPVVLPSWEQKHHLQRGDDAIGATATSRRDGWGFTPAGTVGINTSIPSTPATGSGASSDANAMDVDSVLISLCRKLVTVGITIIPTAVLALPVGSPYSNDRSRSSNDVYRDVYYWREQFLSSGLLSVLGLQVPSTYLLDQQQQHQQCRVSSSNSSASYAAPTPSRLQYCFNVALGIMLTPTELEALHHILYSGEI